MTRLPPSQRPAQRGAPAMTVAIIPALVLTVGLVVGVVGASNLSSSAQVMAGERLTDTAETAARVAGVIESIAKTLAHHVVNMAEHHHDDCSVETWMDPFIHLSASRTAVSRIAIFSRDGRGISIQQPEPGVTTISKHDPDLVQTWRVENGELSDERQHPVPSGRSLRVIEDLDRGVPSWSGPHPIPTPGVSAMTYSVPVSVSDQAASMLVQIDITTADISSAIDRLLVDPDSRLLIYDDNGTLLAASGVTVPVHTQGLPNLDQIRDEAVVAYRNQPKPGIQVMTTPSGGSWLIFQSTFHSEERNWTLAAMTPLAPLIASSRIHLQHAFLITGLTVVLAMVIALLFIRRLTSANRQAAEARAEADALGTYQLESRLGSGGMGEVWRAHHRLLARPAAVKLIKYEGNEGKETDTVERFQREARITASLTSPHTVTVYDFGYLDDGTIYYAMELLEGCDLDSILTDNGALPQEAVVHVLLQMCDSLGEAHAKGLVHRDLKPANIFIAQRGSHRDFVKVLDFGLVALTGQRRAAINQRLTENGFVQGTPGFMAPEQLRDEELDGRTDLYSLGCVAYWLLTGRAVYPAKSMLDELQRHLHDDAEAPSRVTANPIAPELDAIVLDLLHRRKDQRIANANTLAQRLLACGVTPAFPLHLLGSGTTNMPISAADAKPTVAVAVRIKR